MAKLIVENGFLSDEPEKSEYDKWIAGTIEKEIPVNMLYEHPQNYEIVGRIDEHTRAELLEDIKQNGIREPLQVWYNAGKLFVVSGNERLSIAKQLKYNSVKCVKVDFQDNDEVLRFIYAVNKHRKQVKTGAANLLLKLFPVDKYPLLYADLRGDITAGNTDTQKRKTDLDEQRKLDAQAAELIGIKPETLPKVKSQARKKAAINKTKNRPTKKPGPRPPEVNKAMSAYLDSYVKTWKGPDRQAVKALLIKYIKNI